MSSVTETIFRFWIDGPSGEPLAFLDNAASSQRPTAVIDAMADCYHDYYANVHRGIHTLSEESTDRYERARKTIADFINAPRSRSHLYGRDHRGDQHGRS